MTQELSLTSSSACYQGDARALVALASFAFGSRATNMNAYGMVVVD